MQEPICILVSFSGGGGCGGGDLGSTADTTAIHLYLDLKKPVYILTSTTYISRQPEAYMHLRFLFRWWLLRWRWLRRRRPTSARCTQEHYTSYTYTSRHTEAYMHSRFLFGWWRLRWRWARGRRPTQQHYTSYTSISRYIQATMHSNFLFCVSLF